MNDIGNILETTQGLLEVEKITPREALDRLFETGEFLFHGSGRNDITELTPKQANTKDKKTGEYVNDGSPAVFAAARPEISIFMALLGGDAGSFDGHNGSCRFFAASSTVESLPQRKGYVYVLNKKDFANQNQHHEWRSGEPLRPIANIKIGFSDLREKVEVKETL